MGTAMNRPGMRTLPILLIFLLSLGAQTPIPIKVVVVTMFERGEDTGDVPGEYQLWVEREHLDQVLPMPAGYHHVRLNKDGVPTQQLNDIDEIARLVAREAKPDDVVVVMSSGAFGGVHGKILEELRAAEPAGRS